MPADTRRKRYTLPIAALFLSLGIFVVLDLGLAQLCKLACDGLHERSYREKFRVKDPIFHHTMAPGVSVIDKWGGRLYPVFTNSLGFKDKSPREISLEPTDRRFIFIGDSFTEGQGMTWEESSVGRIAAGLAPHGIEVLNAAVSSYAPAVYFAKLRHYIVNVGLKSDHVFVLIDMSDINDSAFWYDVDDEHRVFTRGQDRARQAAFDRGLKSWFKDNSVSVAFAYQLRDRLTYEIRKTNAAEAAPVKEQFVDRELWTSRVANARETTWCFTDEFDDKWANRGVESALTQMSALQELLSDNGVGLTVAVYPWPSNILKNDRRSRCIEPWLKWAQERNVDLLNMFDDFFENDDPWVTLDNYFIPYDVHWNADGHKKVADRLLRHIRERGLIGDIRGSR